MISAHEREHYVTLFDSSFLLSGLALYESLREHAGKFHLWIVGADERVRDQLARLELADVTVIPLAELETPELLAVKAGRTRGEYCWTLTPFLWSAVFARAPETSRVTYLDADLFLFASPRPFFEELEASAKDVMITEHAYAPEYDRLSKSGRFCVQFLTFRRSDRARAVAEWWQQRCVEWCFARYEEGRFGDQKYLDEWPTRFADGVHILSQCHRTLAPWNANHFGRRGTLQPVFFHFQGFRIFASNDVRLVYGYRIDPQHMWIYEAYLARIARLAKRLEQLGYDLPVMPEHKRPMMWLRNLVLRAQGRIRHVSLEGYAAVR